MKIKKTGAATPCAAFSSSPPTFRGREGYCITCEHSITFSLDMKVCTRYIPDVTSKYKIVIGNSLYDTRFLDKTNKEIYWYLTKARDLDAA